MTRTPQTIPDNESPCGEIIRLRASLAAARLESANRLAAIRAAVGAAEDNESDPLAFLRDQLAEEASTPDSGSGL